MLNFRSGRKSWPNQHFRKCIVDSSLYQWARKDSNLRPMDYESTALPLSYEPAYILL